MFIIKNKKALCIVSLLITILITIAPSYASNYISNGKENIELSHAQKNHEPYLALKVAIEENQKSLQQIKPDAGLSYMRIKDDNNGDIKTYMFTPKKASKGLWSPVENTFSNNNSEQKFWENDALFSIEDFDTLNAKFKVETETSWLFELPTFITVNVDTETTDDKKAKELSEVMYAELEVSKKTSRFVSFRIYSIKPFSPMFGVEVDKFETVNILAEAWDNGPSVVTSQTEKLEGTIGFFVSLNDHFTVTNSDFKLVKLE